MTTASTMTTLSTRFSEKELEYLSGIAMKSKLYKSDSKDLSLGKALKYLVKWCQVNDVDITKVAKSMDDDIKKMIEHIHVAIPNLMYLARLQTLLGSDTIPDDKVVHCRKQTVDYLNTVCGDFQNVIYREVRFTMNDIGLKQVPEDKEKTVWKLR